MPEDTPGEGSPEVSKLVIVETAEKILDILSKVQGDTKEKAGEVKLMGSSRRMEFTGFRDPKDPLGTLREVGNLYRTDEKVKESMDSSYKAAIEEARKQGISEERVKFAYALLYGVIPEQEG